MRGHTRESGALERSVCVQETFRFLKTGGAGRPILYFSWPELPHKVDDVLGLGNPPVASNVVLDWATKSGESRNQRVIPPSSTNKKIKRGTDTVTHGRRGRSSDRTCVFKGSRFGN